MTHQNKTSWTSKEDVSADDDDSRRPIFAHSRSNSNFFFFFASFEQERLRSAATRYDNQGHDWEDIAIQVQTRTPEQCRNRWDDVFVNGLVKGPWTQEEDDKLSRLGAFSDDYGAYTTMNVFLREKNTHQHKQSERTEPADGRKSRTNCPVASASNVENAGTIT